MSLLHCLHRSLGDRPRRLTQHNTLGDRPRRPTQHSTVVQEKGNKHTRDFQLYSNVLGNYLILLLHICAKHAKELFMCIDLPNNTWIMKHVWKL